MTYWLSFLGANVHFDLCADSGAADALLGSGVGLGSGTAVQTSC